ncbi:hypothetical protein C8J56DRAFT_1037442 [Mycena floridula]|nr:hypothetical protein C8J56DRAFT_1037442 [Mycena floridula]
MPHHRAYMALLGLSNFGSFSQFVSHDPSLLYRWTSLLISGGSGISAWSQFFFTTRVSPSSLTQSLPIANQRQTADLICGAWYCISHLDQVRDVIISTPSTIELITQCWMLEDPAVCPNLLLRDTDLERLDHVLSALRFNDPIGGNVDAINNLAILALSRLRKAMSKPMMNGIHVAVYINLISQLSRPERHTLRKASVVVNQTLRPDPSLLEVMEAGFGYLQNCISSIDGFPFVAQALHYVDFSPHFVKVDPEAQGMLLSLFRDIIPQYLVYHSVLKAINDSGPCGSEHCWSNFEKVDRQNWKVTCNNSNCSRIDVKSMFQKCSRCKTTLYCSKECQIIAWKEQDHKSICKLKQAEALDIPMMSTRKQDRTFLHYLTSCDAYQNRQKLQTLAVQKFLGKSISDFLDYRTPGGRPKMDLILLDGYDIRSTGDVGNSGTLVDRSNDLIERARLNKGKSTLFESKIPNGYTSYAVVTLVNGAFWESGNDTTLGDSNVEIDFEEGDMAMA